MPCLYEYLIDLLLMDTKTNAQNPFAKLFDTINQCSVAYLFVFHKKKLSHTANPT
jgi:hypothetical protein